MRPGATGGNPSARLLPRDARGGDAEGEFELWSDGGRELELQGALDFVRGSTDLGVPARIPPPGSNCAGR